MREVDISSVRETAGAIGKTASDREVSFLAAGFAYYAFVSMIPLVVLALVVGSLVDGEQAAESLIVFAGDFLPEAGEELVKDTLTTESGRTEATIVALIVATWGALKVLRGLGKGFDAIYGQEVSNSLADELINGAAVLLSVIAALGLMIAIGIFLGRLPVDVPFASLLGWLALFVGLCLVFLPVYYFLPPLSVGAREIVPGTVFTAFGWVVLQFGFQLYAGSAGQYEAYGILGAVFLFVTWLYFAGILIFLGAVVNVVTGRPNLAA